MNSTVSEWKNRLQEGFASTWKLLSDTNHFLSRTKLFVHYESQLSKWRRELQLFQTNTDKVREVRKAIVELRKHLRLQGYNLMLGNYYLRVEGFRSDDAMGHGFQRAVIMKKDNQLFIQRGQDNHNELRDYLALRLQKAGIGFSSELHSLWYRWDNRLLIISGADSETREDFEEFRRDAEENPFFYIEAFRKV